MRMPSKTLGVSHCLDYFYRQNIFLHNVIFPILFRSQKSMLKPCQLWPSCAPPSHWWRSSLPYSYSLCSGKISSICTDFKHYCESVRSSSKVSDIEQSQSDIDWTGVVLTLSFVWLHPIPFIKLSDFRDGIFLCKSSLNSVNWGLTKFTINCPLNYM